MSTRSTTPIALSGLTRCFQGIVPCIVATCDAGGVPNVTYVSQVHRVDDAHVALSRQFFNKTTRNLQVNPRACVEVYDPVTFEAWRLRVRFVREETSGPLFESMALRIEAIASHTGMSGVFRLLAADVFLVEHVARVDGFLGEVPEAAEDVLSADGYRTELRGLQGISARINRATSLEELFDTVLEAIETFFGFRYTMILLHEETCGRLQTIASRGYGPAGIGAEVELGDGILGAVGRERRVLRISGLDHDLSYGRAVRREAESSGSTVSPEIPLAGLADARSALALPLLFQDRLVGVLAAESRDPLQFDEWDEGYLQVIGNHIALGIERMREPAEREQHDTAPAASEIDLEAGQERSSGLAGRKHGFTYYRNDDCVFVDGEYLIRNVPGRILWKVLRTWAHEGRTTFTNRELRLDPSLGLPAIKDNLESRLILLRRRLEQKCPEVQLVPTGRGRFSLVLGGPIELVEKDSGSVTA